MISASMNTLLRVTSPVSLGIHRHTLAGSHRTCSTRDFGLTFVPARVISEAHILALAKAATRISTENDVQMKKETTAVYAALELLMVAAQAENPHPNRCPRCKK